MKIFLAILIIIYGLICIISPKTGFKLDLVGRKWMLKNAEPSNFALIWSRVAGVICIAIAIWLIFSTLSF